MVKAVQRGRFGGGYVIRGMSKYFRPLCHQEVDKKGGKADKDIPFFGAHNSLGMLVCHFFGCLWTMPYTLMVIWITVTIVIATTFVFSQSYVRPLGKEKIIICAHYCVRTILSSIVL